MATRKCRTCDGKCYYIPESCLYEGTIIPRNGVDSSVVLPYLERAQRTYVDPYIGTTCRASLCAAIAAYEATPSTAIPAVWEDLIEAMRLLLVVGTELQYARARGAGRMTQDGVKLPDNFDAEAWKVWMKSLEAGVQEQMNMFQFWLEQNRSSYACLPAKPCTPGDSPQRGHLRGTFSGMGRSSETLDPNWK